MKKGLLSKKVKSAVISCTLALAIAVTGVLSGAGTITAKAAEDPVAAFVERMYTEVLGRPSEEAGKADWTNRLVGHTGDGATLAQGFIKSDEFVNRSVSNEEYLRILYKTFFDRDPDEGGYNDWLAKLNAGTGRDEVLAGFVDSAEFANLCVRYGISQGYMFGDGNVANPGIGLFVYRLYNTLLGRTPDGGGLLDWTSRIANNQMSAAQVATDMFILSPEFQEKQKSMNNSTYLEVLYATFFNRKGDEEGLEYWREQLLYGAERNEIVYGFAGAQEFINLQTSYGLEIKPVKDYVPVDVTDYEPADFYWNYVGGKTCTADGTIVSETKRLFDEQGKYIGSQTYSKYQNADGEYVGEMKLTYEYSIVYNEQGYQAKTVGKNYSIKEDGTTYLSYYNETHFSGEQKNKVTKRIYESNNSDGQPWYRSEREYANGVIAKETSINYTYYDGKQYTSSESEVIYNEEGNPKDGHYVYYSNNTNNNGSFVSYKQQETNTTYTYDGKKKLTDISKITLFSSDGSVTTSMNYQTTHTYEGDNLVLSLTVDADNGEATNKVIYKYDANGNQILSENYYNYTSYNGEKTWKLSRWIERTYDNNSKLLEEKSYTAQDGSKENATLNQRSVYQYTLIDGESYQSVYEYYYSTYVGYDQETGTSLYKLAFAHGTETDYDENGWRVCVRYYQGDENYEKSLATVTKFYNSNFPVTANENDYYEYRYSEEYDANGVLLTYDLDTYQYVKSN